ncbi:hypothetical protein B0H16DRAFT_1729821 [Mycena metata]|uniref:Uncharacterized protein n=1 Tax=Mycena metata TaxID=1033252 RepID=A0AAD7MZ90_9AGAR|nr:hypothetical protein B0H16DRAFT_1729821 [Mycena metata]
MTSSFKMPTSSTTSSGTLGKRTRLEFDDGAPSGSSLPPLASPRKFTAVDVLPSSFADLYKAYSIEVLVQSLDEFDLTTVHLNEDNDKVMSDVFHTVSTIFVCYSSTSTVVASSPLYDRTNKASISGSKSKNKKVPDGVKRTTAGAKENSPYLASLGREGSLARRPYEVWRTAMIFDMDRVRLRPGSVLDTRLDTFTIVDHGTTPFNLDFFIYPLLFLSSSSKPGRHRAADIPILEFGYAACFRRTRTSRRPSSAPALPCGLGPDN